MYATIDDMITRFGENELVQLTDRGGHDQIDVSILNTALMDASDEIDMYLGSKYILPIKFINDIIPKILLRLCCDITRYRLYDDKVIDEVRTRYESAISLLNQFKNNELILPNIDDLLTKINTPSQFFLVEEKESVFGDDF